MNFSPQDDLLGHFDFAMELSAEQSRNRERTRRMLLSFVEVMDSFDRFLQATSREPELALASSVILIRKQFLQALEACGVTRIQVKGAIAEPDLHEIFGTQPSADMAEYTIMEEIACGYEWDGEILRKPRVIVAGAAEEGKMPGKREATGENRKD